MEITSQYAQSIVDMTMKAFHYNVNIMDHMGIIVGSGDKKRIGSFHQGAAEVIRTGKPLEISIEQAKQLKGAKPGVNLPIFFNEKIVGVVGITEDPNKVKPFGELLKMSVETMLQQNFLSEQLRLEQHVQELYIQDILNGNFAVDDEAVGIAKGELVGFNMAIPRVAMAIKILCKKTLNEMGKKFSSDHTNLKLNLKIQKRNENILHDIKTVFNNPQNMISYNGSDYFVIFYVNQGVCDARLKKALIEPLRRLQSKLDKYNVDCLIGAGLFHAGIGGLKKSYNEAIQAIYIGERTRDLDNEINKIILTHDVILEMAVINQSGHTLLSYIDLILTQNDFFSRPKLIATLKDFFECNLNQSIAAKKMGISRNTLINRLDMVNDLTGYDPRSFSDAAKLELIILIKELINIT